VPFEKLPGVTPDRGIELFRWRSFAFLPATLLIAECSRGDRHAALRAFDVILMHRSRAARADFAFRILGAAKTSSAEEIIRIFRWFFGFGLCRSLRALWHRHSYPATALFAFDGFSCRLIRHIQDSLATLATNLDWHGQSLEAIVGRQHRGDRQSTDSNLAHVCPQTTYRRKLELGSEFPGNECETFAGQTARLFVMDAARCVVE